MSYHVHKLEVSHDLERLIKSTVRSLIEGFGRNEVSEKKEKIPNWYLSSREWYQKK